MSILGGDKTLRWVEPFSRTMDEIHRSHDTGLCNRLLHWEIAQEINKHNNYEYTILLGQSRWPELDELIELPNTKVSPELETETDRVKLKRLIDNATPIGKGKLNELLKSNWKLEGYSFYSSFGHNTLQDLYDTKHKEFNSSERPISTITLKDKNLEDKIKSLTKGLVGIHIRRGRGIKYNQDNIETLPKEIREDYINFRKLEGEETRNFYIYDFVSDEVYFDIIDKFLKRNPTQKFYISHDMPDNLFTYFKEKYQGIVYTKEYFYGLIENKFKTPIQHVKNVIDLFALSNTDIVLKHNISTWSTFAHKYKEKIGFYHDDDIDEVIDNYLKIT